MPRSTCCGCQLNPLIVLYWINMSKRRGDLRFFYGMQGCSEGYIEGKAQGKSRGGALPNREN